MITVESYGQLQYASTKNNNHLKNNFKMLIFNIISLYDRYIKTYAQFLNALNNIYF